VSVVLHPQQRTIRRGDHGKDVLAVKYALKHAGFKRGIVLNDHAGGAFVDQVNRMRHQFKLGDGPYDSAAHKALKRHIAAVPYATWLWNHYTIPKVNKRALVVNTALFGAAHEPTMHYTQSALRMQGVRQHIRPPACPHWEDCSSFSTWCYWVAGAVDPNGRGYDGQGYTGTLTDHGRVVSYRDARPGDLIFYGGTFSVPGHVVVYIGNGRAVSHGSESGPKIVSATYRPINHVRSYLP